MSLLNRTKRVKLENGDWIDVRPLTIGGLRAMRQAAAAVEVPPGEEKEEAQGFELSRLALESCIVAWSDDAPVNPDNIANLPYDIMFELTAAIGLGGQERPLASGTTSTES